MGPRAVAPGSRAVPSKHKPWPPIRAVSQTHAFGPGRIYALRGKKCDPSFTGNCRSFAEYRVSTGRIAQKMTPSKDNNHFLQEMHMNPLTTKLTAFAAALAMNGFVMGFLGYCFALQSNTHMTVVAFAKAIATQQWLS